MPAPSVLSKKTKTELIDEYQKLQERLEEATQQSHLAFAPSSSEAIASGKSLQAAPLQQSVRETTGTIRSILNDATETVEKYLADSMTVAEDQLRKFSSLQEAIERSQEVLKTHYNVEVVAATLEALVKEYEEKKTRLEQEFSGRHQQLEEEAARSKRQWQWEQEEQEHQKITKMKRSEEEFSTLRAKHQQELEALKNDIQTRQNEIQQLRDRAATEQERIDSAVKAAERLLTDRLTIESKQRLAQETERWEHEKQVWELERKGLLERIKEIDLERAMLRKETEAATKRAQELAIKIVETSARMEQQSERQQASGPV